MAIIKSSLTKFTLVACLIVSSTASFATCTTGACPEKIETWINSVHVSFPYRDLDKLEGPELIPVIYNMFYDKYFIPIFNKPADQLSEEEKKELRKLINKCDPKIIPGHKNEIQILLNGSTTNHKKFKRTYLWSQLVSNIVLTRKIRGSYNKALKELPQKSLGEILELKNLDNDYLHNWHALLFPSELRHLDNEIEKQIPLTIERQVEDELDRLADIGSLIYTESFSSFQMQWGKNNLRILKEYGSYQDNEWVKALFKNNAQTKSKATRIWVDYQLSKVADKANRIDLRDWNATYKVMTELAEQVKGYNRRFNSGTIRLFREPETDKLVTISNSTLDSLVKEVIAYEEQAIKELRKTKSSIVLLEELAKRKSSYEDAKVKIPEIINFYATTIDNIIIQATEQERRSTRKLLKSEKSIALLNELVARRLVYRNINRALGQSQEFSNLIDFLSSSYASIETQIIETNNDQLFELAMVYLNGSTKYQIKKNKQKGVELLEICATNGDPEAQYLFGKLYLDRTPTRDNLSQAAFWIYKSKVAGNANAEVLWTKHQLEKYL